MFIAETLLTFPQVTIGVFGYPEHVISEPMTPKDLVKIIYDKCMPFDPTEAVLQQEVSTDHRPPSLSPFPSSFTAELCVEFSDHDLPGELCVQYLSEFCL